jgi:hypothetical protein
MKLTEREFQDNLQDALYELAEERPWDELAVDSIDTFEQAGVLTLNKGLVVRLNNGQCFQLTIVEA